MLKLGVIGVNQHYPSTKCTEQSLWSLVAELRHELREQHPQYDDTVTI